MMWALSETDIKSLSLTNTVSTVCFAVGAFLLGCVVNILIGCGVSSAPLGDVGKFLSGTLSWYLGAFSALSFIGGICALYQKSSMMERIKSETRQISQ